jgi:predicted ester cyclase
MGQEVIMAEREKELEQRTLRGWEYFNSRAIDPFVQGMAPDYVWYSPAFPEPIHGPEGTKKGLEMFFSVFPDVQFTVDQVWATGTYTMVRFSGNGSRTNGFMGLPPTTNTPYTYQGAAINHFNERGQRDTTWVFFDRYGLLQQIGALPPQLGSYVPGTIDSAARLPDPAVSPAEEVIMRYGMGEFKILEDPQYIVLHIDMFKPNGERGGYYKGIQQTSGLLNPQQLMTKPPMPPLPIDQPGGIPRLLPGANYKATWWLTDQDSITAVGPSMASLVPLRDGSMIFSTTAMGIITGGTGQYEGASGIKSAFGSVHLPKGAQLAPGVTAVAKTLDIFRVVKEEYQALLPPSSVGGRGAPGPSAPGQPGALPLPPTFPPGVNPETYRIKEVTHLLQQAAYFSLFSMPNPAQPNQPVYAPGVGMIGVKVHEYLHHFDVTVEQPTQDKGLRATNVVGQPVAQVHIDWRPIPDDYVASPGQVPPPTPLDPTRSQRFVMLDGQFQFDDRRQSGFHGFGTGRTFPVMIDGQPQLRIGAVIDILQGDGQLSGKQGTVVVNGYITPPEGLALNILVRLLDPSGDLLTRAELSPVQPIPNPDPGTTFFMFLGEEDFSQPTTLQSAPDGRMLGASVHERLRLVQLGFDLGRRTGLRTSIMTGPIVGTLSGTLSFNPFGAAPASPVPFQTQNGVFSFFDRDGKTVGTLMANIIEGRAFPAALHGAPMPVFRFGGFGPFIQGTGPFDRTIGLMSLNAVISVFPRTLSNLYILRCYDPERKLHDTLRSAWS